VVNLLDRFIRGIQQFFGVGQTDIDEEEGQDSDGILPQQPTVPEGEEITTFEFRRKFVSGLFYCGGKKVQFFGLTFEQNDTIREDELLGAIEDRVGSQCSDIRQNFGYSDDFVSRSQVRGTAIFPDIEVGEL